MLAVVPSEDPVLRRTPSPGPHKWSRQSILMLPSENVDQMLSDSVGKHLAHLKLQQNGDLQQAEDLEVPRASSVQSAQHHRRALSNGVARPKYLRTSRIQYRSMSLSVAAQKAPRVRRELPARPASSPAAFEESKDMQVFESSASVLVTCKGEQHHVPPHMWLVVDCSFVGEQDECVKLVDDAGGGFVSEGDGLLRPVPRARLHADAAEANFKRASHSTSLLALQHATLALAHLSQRYERELAGVVLNKKNGMVRRAMQEAISPVELAAVRFESAKGLVKQQAAAAEERLLSLPRPQPRMLLEHTDHAKLSRRMSMLRKGFHAKWDLLEFAHRRFGNTMRFWFQLDLEENMKLGQRLFLRRCDELGWRGSGYALWRYLYGDSSGSLTFQELDPGAAQMLASFQAFTQDLFGGAIKSFSKLDTNRSGRIVKQEFIERLESLGCTGSLSRLFDMLDRNGFGFLSNGDLNFLDHWKPHPYFMTSPDDEGLHCLKNILKKHYKAPLFRAWRRMFDRQCKMRINWGQFCNACEKIQRHCMLPSGFLTTNERVASIWRALDEDCTGWASFRAFDPEGFEALVAFKAWMEQRFGSSTAAFRKMDVDESGKLKLWEMREFLENPVSEFNADIELVFESLDMNSSGSLSVSEIVWLDSWEFLDEEFDPFASTPTVTVP